MSLLVNGFKHFLTNPLINNVKTLLRSSYPVRCASSYECDGKTTICILNKEYEHGIFLDSYGNTGFRLNNGVSIIGPLVIFQRSVLSWNIAGPDDITKESLSLFTVLEPKIDLLVIGLGDMGSFTSFNNRVKRMAMELGINCETLPTESACSTYNFLVSEGRNAAACLIPPVTMVLMDDDVVRSNSRYNYPFMTVGDDASSKD